MSETNHDIGKYRFRLIFAKKALAKYISHLDLVLAWERALRRANIPLAYSQGFNPRPKMQVASGLPLGTCGAAEIMDIVLTQPLPPPEILARMRISLPAGLELLSIVEVPLKSPTLQNLLRQAEYRVIVETELSAAELTQRIEALLAASTCLQTRQRKQQQETFDLRPWLHALHLETLTQGQAHLTMRLTAGQFGNLRPEEVLKALGLPDTGTEIERTCLIFADDLLA